MNKTDTGPDQPTPFIIVLQPNRWSFTGTIRALPESHIARLNFSINKNVLPNVDPGTLITVAVTKPRLSASHRGDPKHSLRTTVANAASSAMPAPPLPTPKVIHVNTRGAVILAEESPEVRVA